MLNAFKAALKAHIQQVQVIPQEGESLYQAHSRILLAAAPQCMQAITLENARNACAHVKLVVNPKAIAMENL